MYVGKVFRVVRVIKQRMDNPSVVGKSTNLPCTFRKILDNPTYSMEKFNQFGGLCHADWITHVQWGKANILVKVVTKSRITPVQWGKS